MFTTRLVFSALGGLLLLLPACDRVPGGEESADEKGEGDDKAAKADAAKGPCDKYADELCKNAGGEKSPTCAAVRTTADLMPPEACNAGLENMEYTLAKLEEKGKVCEELADKLCKDLGKDTHACGLVQEQTPEMPPQQCEGMMKEYDKVLAQLERINEQNKPLDPEVVASLAEGDVPAFGPEDAEVVVVEFSDFECPYCSRAANAVNKLKEEYGDNVRFVFRQFPLSMHPNAQLAAEAALAAHEQGKFWEYHDLLFKNQRELEREKLEEYAKEVGLDMEQFKTALDERKYKEQVKQDMELGRKVNVSGTPTMFIDGKRVSNATDFGSIEKAIKTAKEKPAGEAKAEG